MLKGTAKSASQSDPCARLVRNEGGEQPLTLPASDGTPRASLHLVAQRCLINPYHVLTNKTVEPAREMARMLPGHETRAPLKSESVASVSQTDRKAS
jgi:hypothetical protein